jgi:hypothetical protein
MTHDTPIHKDRSTALLCFALVVIECSERIGYGKGFIEDGNRVFSRHCCSPLQ